MKPINISKETEEKLLKACVDKFRKEIENFKFNINDTKFDISFKISEPAKEKVIIQFSQSAYIKMHSLVNFYDTEVGWYGLVEKIADKVYRVYDVKVCQQYVSGSKVDTEDKDTLDFFNSLTDDEAEHMHFQAHSHVKMSTEASGVDLQNQADIVHNMGKKGFYIFQIWNKFNDINTYLYDLDANVFYDSKDVIIEIETDDGLVSEFLDSTLDFVTEKKKYPYAKNTAYNNYGYAYGNKDYKPYDYEEWRKYVTFEEGWD